MPRTTDSRTRMVSTAGRLLRRQGYAATGWREVVRESGAPWGSQSHHFPGGKAQLAAEAIERGGRTYREMLELALADVHPAEMVENWAALAARQLAESGWADGCPIATVTLEQAQSSDELAGRCHQAFSSWVRTLESAIEARGVATGDARALGTLVVAGIEGALVLARAARDPEPLRIVGAQLAGVLRTNVP